MLHTEYEQEMLGQELRIQLSRLSAPRKFTTIGEGKIEARAIRIAEEAGRHVMSFFLEKVKTRAKTRTSFVSEADESTEEHLRKALASAFPGEAVLGEEFGLDAEPEGAWWVIDPIDGTSNFLSGLPLFCVSIARMENGRATLGVTHVPCTGETYHAVRGHGAFLGEDRLRMDTGDRGRLTTLAMRHSMVRRHPELLDRIGTDKVRCLGSACLELAYVAAGRLQALMARHLFLWDCAAGALFIQEAGGEVHTAEGRPLFPLALPARDYESQRTPIIAGAPYMVKRLENANTSD